jgi:hypothetical protein
MTNEMKLITALCDALGFDVEKVCVNQDSIRQSEAGNLARLRGGCFGYGGAAIEPMYQVEPIYEYILVKRYLDEAELTEKEEKGHILRNEPILTKWLEPENKVSLNELTEEPFTKIKESDEIFNTEMFGEVRISRSMEYGTRIDTKKNGQYFTNFVDDSVCISYVIKVIDCMYSARGKA